MDTTPFSNVVDLYTAFESINDYWSPKVVATFNNQYVKVIKVRGEFVWHDHKEEDEFFYVVRGNLRMTYENDEIVELPAGSFHVVKRGVQHKPVADEECWLVVIETVTTKHTGDVSSPLTKSIVEQLS